MNLTARSSAAVLLGLTIALGAPATSAQAQVGQPGGCGTPATPADPTPGEPGATPATPASPGRCTPGPDRVLGTADDVFVLDVTRVRRADTGAGGSSSSGSEGIVLLVGSGLVVLAAVGVRRASRGGKA